MMLHNFTKMHFDNPLYLATLKCFVLLLAFYTEIKAAVVSYCL